MVEYRKMDEDGANISMESDDKFNDHCSKMDCMAADLCEEKVESWLDTHPDFVQSYFTRKANRTLLDGFLRYTRNSRARAATPPVERIERSNSGNTTPVRKISASDLDGRGILKPLVSLVDGSPSFLSLDRPAYHRPTRQRKSKEELNQLRVLDEHAFLVELVRDIASDLELTGLCHKILQNVSILTNGDRCSLFLAQGSKEGRYLVSKVFDVNADSRVEDLEGKEEICVPFGRGIVGYTAETGETVNIPDAYKDARFNQTIDKKTGYRTKSILCMPVKGSEGEVIGVAQVINKMGTDFFNQDQTFTEEDEKIFAKYLVFCGIGITNAQLYEKSQLEIKRNQLLLDLARVIFEEQDTLHNIVHKIMMNTQSILQCERCSVLLVDPTSKGLFSKAFDLEAHECLDDDGETVVRKQSCGSSEVRFPINIGITGYVATTGETLNIPDAYADPRFDPSVDEGSGFKTRTILCMPIKSSKNEILGVVQLLNKMDGMPFNENDENLFEAFAIFCGMAIHNTAIYEECNKAMTKQKVALEVLSYHATAPNEEASQLKVECVPSASKLHLNDVSFDDLNLSDRETLVATLRMFVDLQFIQTFQIDYLSLCRWVLSVKKNYRNVTYHNWRHAFNVAQVMFCMLKGVKEFQTEFTGTEKLALLIGCLCHDLDHRGTNNTFQIKSASPLAQLYSTSTMEHHHFDQCIMILNSPGNELLSQLSTDEYSEILKFLEDAIIATDLALYFKKRGDFFSLVKNHNYNWEDTSHRTLLRAMLMTACDVSAITKPWIVQKRVAHLVAEEFFQQGDLEQKELKQAPAEIMDRKKKDLLPKMQVGFIEAVCLPVYQSLADQFPYLRSLVNGCIDNKSHWQKLADDYERSSNSVTDPLLEKDIDKDTRKTSERRTCCSLQ